MRWPWGSRRDADSVSDQKNLERSARCWMRAYPRRWRVTFGEDFIGIVLDVSAAGVRRVPIREGIEIVRAGWALRWRERPPFWLWLNYRTAARRLPEQYRFWVIDDLLGSLYGFRMVLPSQVFFLIPMGILSAFPGILGPYNYGAKGVIVYVTSIIVVTMAAGRYRARADWRKLLGTEPPLELQPRRHRRQQTET